MKNDEKNNGSRRVERGTRKDHKNNESILKVTVDFVAEVITCVKDKNKKIVVSNNHSKFVRMITYFVLLYF